MSRLSIGRLIAIAMVVTIVLLFSIDTTLACRHLWRSHHYRSCGPVYYYCPPAPCRVVTTPSCSSSAPAPAAVHESVEMPEPPSAEMLDSAEPMTDSPSDDTTGFSEPSKSTDDPSDTLVDEPEIVDDLPDVTVDDSDAVIDLPDEPTADVPDETTIDLPDDTPDALEDDPLGDIFDEPTDTLPDATDTPTDEMDDPLGDIFDESTDALPDDAADTPDDTADDPLGDIFDESLDGTDTGTELPADNPDDSLDDIFDESLPGEDAGTGDDELMDDLFGGTEPADTTEPRVANNPDEDVEEDELFRELEEATDVDLDTDLPAADELFPQDEEDANGTSSDATEDDLDDLFSGGLPRKEPLGFHEVKVAEPKPTEPVVEPSRGIEVTPREGVTRNVERFTPSVRVWTDNTGMYTTVGRLVKIGETHVRLLKENGRFSTVPKRRLSQADLAYVQEMVQYLGIEELDYVARR